MFGADRESMIGAVSGIISVGPAINAGVLRKRAKRLVDGTVGRKGRPRKPDAGVLRRLRTDRRKEQLAETEVRRIYLVNILPRVQQLDPEGCLITCSDQDA